MKKTIITIGREFGSGGREIGKKLADQLGIAFYDKELIAIAAKESGLNEDLIESIEETAATTFQYSSAMVGVPLWSGISMMYDVPMNDKLFLIQSNVIKNIAKTESCVIVGRCADYILKDDSNTINMFIHANKEFRLKRAIEVYDMPKENAEKNLLKIDKKRGSYYNYYTSKKWGVVDNYHISADSGKLGIEKTIKLLKAYVELI